MTITCPVCSSPRTSLFCEAIDRVLRTPEARWSIVQCEECGFGWTWPPLAEEEIGAFYPPAYLGDTARMIREYQAGELQQSRSWRKETEKVKLVERFSKGGEILDVGCADARFLLALDLARWNRWGVEFSEPVVKKVIEAFPGLRLITGDVHSPALPQRHFNVICFWHVLEHLPSPARVLRRVGQLLKPGGLVIVSFPNFDSLQARLFGRFWYGFDDVPRHLHHFTPNSLARLLADAGFRCLDSPLFFSRIVNFHCLKYSLMNWSVDRFNTRMVYYALKPLLPSMPLIEMAMSSYGIATLVARFEGDASGVKGRQGV